MDDPGPGKVIQNAGAKSAVFLSPVGTLGGAERVLLGLLQPWPVAGLDVVPKVVCLGEGPLVAEIRRLGVPVSTEPLPERLTKLGDTPSSKENRLVRMARFLMAAPAFFRSVWRWKKWFRREAPAWIHSNGFKTHILSAWSAPGNTPIYWHLHDFVGERPLMRKLLKSSWRPGIEAIAISAAVSEDFKRVLPGCPVRVWHNSIDCRKFQPGIGEGAWLDQVSGLSPGFAGSRVGLVATYARWKGHEVFLEACSRILRDNAREIRFYIVGGPTYQTTGSQWTDAELLGIIRDLGLQGKVGLVPFQKDTSLVYRSLDVVVHASTRPEPFGLVIAEAMACGRPVVAALHGGAREIGTSGVDCEGHEPGDPESLARGILRFVDNASHRELVGRAAREKIVGNFGDESVARNWQALLVRDSKVVDNIP